MSKLRISVVEFLNTAPLVWGFTAGPLAGRYDLSFTVPSGCAEALRAGDVDIAIIPSVEYQRMDGMVMLPEMSIAAKGEVRSILVLAKKPIENVRRIALDTSSRSSVALTRLLCQGLWRIAPEFVDSSDPLGMLRTEADAALVIGDPALRVRLKVDALAERSAATLPFTGANVASANTATGPGHPSPSAAAPARSCCGHGDAISDGNGHASDLYPVPGVNTLFVYDVAQQWRQMTGKPCVLAVWVGRRDAITPEVVADFLASQEHGLAHIGDIAESAALKLDLPPRSLETYLRDNIDFSLDAENRDGLEHFYNLCAGAGLIPGARPIDFVAAPERIAAGITRRATRAPETETR